MLLWDARPTWTYFWTTPSFPRSTPCSRWTTRGCGSKTCSSTNGTLVNGKSIHEPVLLEVGDRVAMGETVFQVRVR